MDKLTSTNAVVDERQLTFLIDSPDSLYDGMKVEHDIYAANRNILLMRAGAVLDNRMIEALQRINNYEDVIHIAFETHAQMIEYKLACKVMNREEIEKETGYAEAKDMTQELIAELEDAEIIEPGRAADMSDELCEKIENTDPDEIMSLINSLGPVDEYLPRHCVEVGMLCGLLGKWIGCSSEETDSLVTTGLLHDCGKASVPKQILGAPRKLATAEFEVIKMHAIYSYEMLANIPGRVPLAVRLHHERMDGRGYPDGLKGNEIPRDARITAICDIYDAMVSRRAYKKEFSPFRILKMLESMRGTELDTELTDVFISKTLEMLLEKPVILSNGDIAVVQENNPENIEYPYVRTISGIIKTDSDIYCTSMYIAD